MLIEGHKAIAAVNYVREDHETTECDGRTKVPGFDMMLLTPVRAHEELYTLSRETEKSLITNILNAFVDQIQIDINVGSQGSSTERGHRSYVGVRRRCG